MSLNMAVKIKTVYLSIYASEALSPCRIFLKEGGHSRSLQPSIFRHSLLTVSIPNLLILSLYNLLIYFTGGLCLTTLLSSILPSYIPLTNSQSSILVTCPNHFSVILVDFRDILQEGYFHYIIITQWMGVFHRGGSGIH